MEFSNLQHIIEERGVKKAVIARRLGISERALHRKIKGGAPFSWEQACIIQEQFFPDLELKSLFSKNKETHVS